MVGVNYALISLQFSPVVELAQLEDNRTNF